MQLDTLIARFVFDFLLRRLLIFSYIAGTGDFSSIRLGYRSCNCDRAKK
jgi:hypothetical protein